MKPKRPMLAAGLFVVCLQAGIAVAAPPGVDVPRGATVHLFGDSIVKGWGFGKYDHPSPLCRIQDIGNLLARDNLATPPKIERLAPRPDEDGKSYAENPGLLVAARCANGEIGLEDWIFYEDAGPHGASYQAYRRKLAGICEAAAGAKRRVFLMTMFDYKPSIPESRYDDPTRDEPSKSINDAIRDEAAAQRVTLIDMNRHMDQLQAHLKDQGWGSTCHRDGIHPNVFGNLLMALVLLRAMGADVAQWKLDGIETHFLHPEAGGDVPDMKTWLWPKDPTDDERRGLVREVRRVAVEGLAKGR